MARKKNIHLNSGVSGATPTLAGADGLQLGEIAVNYANGQEALIIKNGAGTAVKFEPFNSSSLDNITNEITSLQTDITNLQSDVTNLETTVSGNTTNITNLQNTVSGHTTSITNLETTVSGHTTEITNLQNIVSGHTTDISNLESGLSAEIIRATAAESTLDTEKQGLLVAGTNVTLTPVVDSEYLVRIDMTTPNLYSIVATLPTSGETNVIYLVPQTGSTTNNFEEWIWVNNAWEDMGALPVEVDLTNYYTKSQIDTFLSTKADLTGLTQEITDRETADTELGSRIDTIEANGVNAADLIAGNNVQISVEPRTGATESGATITISASDTTYNPATTTTNGLMSSADKTKLDGITAGAQANVIEAITSSVTYGTGQTKNSVITSTGKTVHIATDLTDLATTTFVNSGLTAINEALAEETTIRIASDAEFRGDIADLNSGLTAEIEARSDSDTEFRNGITALEDALAEEIARATSASTANTGRIDAINTKLNSTAYVTNATFSGTPTNVEVTVTLKNPGTETTSTSNRQIPVVTTTNAGVVTPDMLILTQENRQKIEALELNTSIEITNQPTKADLDNYTLPGTAKEGDTAVVQTDETQGGASTRYKLEGDPLAWVFNLKYGAPTAQATNTSLGTVMGAEDDGKIFVELDGTMSLVGFNNTEKRLNAGSNITIDRTNPDSPVISAADAPTVPDATSTIKGIATLGAAGGAARYGQKADVGLSNVDNTTDLTKPISNATQTALNNKVDKITTANRVYVVDGSSVQGGIRYSTDALANAIPLRGSTGDLSVPATVTGNNAIGATQVDNKIVAASDTLNARIDTKQDILTAGYGITISGTTISGRPEWFGDQSTYDGLTKDTNTLYYIYEEV